MARTATSKAKTAEITRVMVCVRRRVSAAMTVNKSSQMGAVDLGVALGRGAGLLDRQEQRPAGGAKLGKRPGVQLAGQRVAQRMVGYHALDHGPGSPQRGHRGMS